MATYKSLDYIGWNLASLASGNCRDLFIWKVNFKKKKTWCFPLRNFPLFYYPRVQLINSTLLSSFCSITYTYQVVPYNWEILKHWINKMLNLQDWLGLFNNFSAIFCFNTLATKLLYSARSGHLVQRCWTRTWLALSTSSFPLLVTWLKRQFTVSVLNNIVKPWINALAFSYLLFIKELAWNAAGVVSKNNFFFLATVHRDDCVNYYVIQITKISKWSLLVKRDFALETVHFLWGREGLPDLIDDVPPWENDWVKLKINQGQALTKIPFLRCNSPRL